MAGESPDRSKQRESSEEPTSGSASPVPGARGESGAGARDPRLAVARDRESPARGGVDTATRVFQRPQLPADASGSADGASTPDTAPEAASEPEAAAQAAEPGSADGTDGTGSTRLRAAVAAWVSGADEGESEGVEGAADAPGPDADAKPTPTAETPADAPGGDEEPAEAAADEAGPAEPSEAAGAASEATGGASTDDAEPPTGRVNPQKTEPEQSQKPETGTGRTPEAKPDTGTAARAGTASVSESGSEQKQQAATGSGSAPEAKPGTGTAAGTGTASVSESGSGSESKQQAATGSGSAPEAKPDTGTEAGTGTASVSEPVTGSGSVIRSKSKAESAPKAGSAAESETEPKSGSGTGAESVSGAKSGAESKSVTGLASEPATGAATGAESKSGSADGAKSKSVDGADSAPDAKSNAGTAAGVGAASASTTVTGTGADSGPETGSRSKSEPEPKTGSVVGAESGIASKSGPVAGARAESAGGPESESESEPKSESESAAKPESGTKSGPGARPGSGSAADPEHEPDADAGGNSAPGADVSDPARAPGKATGDPAPEPTPDKPSADQPTPDKPSADKPPVDQPTAVFKVGRPPVVPPVDQPTTMLKLGDLPARAAKGAGEPKADDAGADADAEGKGESVAERTSKFVALRQLDDPATRKAPPAVPPVGDPAKAPPVAPARPAKVTPADATAAIPQVGPERTTQQPLPPLPPLDLLAELTNTPPPRDTAVRTIARRVKIWTPVVILLAIVFAVVQAVRPLPPPELTLTAKDSYTFDGTAAALPWPSDGQGWMDVNGIGTMGKFGEQKPVAIGSVAKAMTAYLILKDHPLKVGEEGPKITIDATAEKEGGYNTDGKGESTLDTVKTGDTLTLKQALSAVMIPSANNIARLLARWDDGTEAAFIKKMNDTAKELGMKNTTYTDASGLKETTVSTAEDQVKLGNQLVRMPALMAITSQPFWYDPTGKRWRNWNEVIPANGGIGIKTGTTSAAGGNLLFAATKEVGGETAIVVGAVLGQHTAPIIDTVNNVSRTAMIAAREALLSSKILKKGDVVGYVDDGLGGQTPVVLSKDVTAIGWAGRKVELSFAAADDLPHSAKAGTAVGTLTVGDGNGGAVKVPVQLQKDLAEPGFDKKLTRIG
ncbi:D-alanyl-D-alanine carboxypeptidase [Streptomyces turgidiscabies]|nr:D-alanyl-D-alanine carboxypeptidase [Streptomyces turgidiscabies]GAQ70519.1 D-alanyl-D-alanine carboxypeptidase DacF [Streptomyces turgidiscabies]